MWGFDFNRGINFPRFYNSSSPRPCPEIPNFIRETVLSPVLFWRWNRKRSKLQFQFLILTALSVILKHESYPKLISITPANQSIEVVIAFDRRQCLLRLLEGVHMNVTHSEGFCDRGRLLWTWSLIVEF